MSLFDNPVQFIVTNLKLFDHTVLLVHNKDELFMTNVPLFRNTVLIFMTNGQLFVHPGQFVPNEPWLLKGAFGYTRL